MSICALYSQRLSVEGSTGTSLENQTAEVDGLGGDECVDTLESRLQRQLLSFKASDARQTALDITQATKAKQLAQELDQGCTGRELHWSMLLTPTA